MTENGINIMPQFWRDVNEVRYAEVTQHKMHCDC